jgi:hypothetical protein
MRKPVYTAREREDACAEAEQLLTTKGRPKGEPAIVPLKPSQIKTRPELFQPREFSYGFRELDRDHVKKLVRALETSGDLDPIVVIKLKGKGWVCVDGHHRLAAYQKVGRDVIKCEWFGGTVQEAIDESMLRNKKDRLNVPQSDRLEEAWKRVVLNWGSKSATAQTCGVSDGTVAHMRRVKATAQAKDAAGTLFRERMRDSGWKSVKDAAWAQIKLVHAGVGKKEVTDESRAAKLARRIGARLTNLLSRNPDITARALQIYDPELPEKLIEAWGKQGGVQATQD